MIITVNENGNVRSIPAQVNQGSVGEKVQIVAPAFEGSLCKLSIMPPTQVALDPIVCTMYQGTDGSYIWEATLPASVVNNPGTCTYQVAFYTANYQGATPTLVKASESGSFYVRRGVITIVPETAADLSAMTLSQIWNLLAVYENKFDAVDTAKTQAQTYATNASNSATAASNSADRAFESAFDAGQSKTAANNAKTAVQAIQQLVIADKETVLNAKNEIQNESIPQIEADLSSVRAIGNTVLEYKGQVTTLKNAAETAKTGAETAQELAETAYSNAQGVLAQVNAVAGNVTKRIAFDNTSSFLAWYNGNGSVIIGGVTYRPSDLTIGDDIYIKEKIVSDLWYSGINETNANAYWYGLPFSALETDSLALSNEVATARIYAGQAQTAEGNAVLAKTASQTAQGLAESAKDDAVSAKDDAETAKGECDSVYEQVGYLKDDVLEAIEDFEETYESVVNLAGTVSSHSTEIADLKTRVNTLEDIQELDITKIQQIVQNGVAKKYIQVGDVISTYKETSITANIGLSQGITSVTIDANTFMSAYGHSFNGEVMFIYDDSKWYLHEEEVALTTYGLTVVGSARNGDEIIVHETSAKLKFEVMDFDTETPTDTSKTHSLPLLLQDVYTYGSLPFCNAQLMYYARDGLSAGTYYFRCYRADFNCTNNDYYMQFTIANDIEAGGGFRHNRLGVSTSASNYTKEYMLGGNIITYGAMVNTNGIYTRPTIETISVTEGQSGTYLGCFSAEFYSGYTTVDEQHNATRRNGYGNNRWDTSYHRQWLNSNASANSGWYTPQSNFDMPPSEALQKWAGFLNGLDADFVSAIGTTKQKCAYGSWDRGMGLGDYYETEDKIFYASMMNMNQGINNGIAEGSVWKYWQDHNTNGDRIKYQGTTARYWWLRSCYPSYCNFTRSISTSGALNDNVASISYGVVPACVIV